MGLLISNRLSALNKALCMPCGGLCLFTVRSFIPVSSRNVRATRQVFSSKEHNQRNNLEGMGAWTPTDFTRKGRFKGDESGAAKATEISIAPRSRFTGTCLLNAPSSPRVEVASLRKVLLKIMARKYSIPYLPPSPSLIVLSVCVPPQTGLWPCQSKN